jgi:hypothetical protein
MLRITENRPLIYFGELFSALFKQNFAIDAVEGINKINFAAN